MPSTAEPSKPTSAPWAARLQQISFSNTYGNRYYHQTGATSTHPLRIYTLLGHTLHWVTTTCMIRCSTAESHADKRINSSNREKVKRLCFHLSLLLWSHVKRSRKSSGEKLELSHPWKDWRVVCRKYNTEVVLKTDVDIHHLQASFLQYLTTGETSNLLIYLQSIKGTDITCFFRVSQVLSTMLNAACFLLLFCHALRFWSLAFCSPSFKSYRYWILRNACIVNSQF